MLTRCPAGEHQAAGQALLGSAPGFPASREPACAGWGWGGHVDTVHTLGAQWGAGRAGAATDLFNVECFHLKDQVFNRPPGDFRRRKPLKVTKNRR